jgi:hypothetical protein
LGVAGALAAVERWPTGPSQPLALFDVAEIKSNLITCSTSIRSARVVRCTTLPNGFSLSA